MFEKRKDSNQDGPKAHFEAGLQDLSASTGKPASSGRSAMIGPQIKINGDISGSEDLLVEGTVEGKIKLKDYRVEIGQTGKVHANISAKVVKIDGEVEGDVTGQEKVIITRNGNVKGNIVAPRLTLEDGAKFKGSIDMDPGEAPVRAAQPLKPAAPKSASNGQGHIPEKPKADASLTLKSD